MRQDRIRLQQAVRQVRAQACSTTTAAEYSARFLTFCASEESKSAYAAGFCDADACYSCVAVRPGKTYRYIVSISQKSKNFLEAFKQVILAGRGSNGIWNHRVALQENHLLGRPSVLRLEGVFAPVPPRRDLLPTVFRGVLPSVAAPAGDWGEDLLSPSQSMSMSTKGWRAGSSMAASKGGMAAVPSMPSGPDAAADGSLLDLLDDPHPNLCYLSFEEGGRLAVLARQLAETVPQPDRGHVVLGRGGFCRLALALSGLSHFE
ncbi:unnamed protein product, partial [Prorocentrum cordatum]